MEARKISTNLINQLLVFVALCGLFLVPALGKIHRHDFVVKEASYTRLCKTKNIVTVNGMFPGPTLHVHKGDTVIVNVYNKGNENVTIHWHGVKQPRNPWSDGPAYITQCPIQPGARFSYTIVFSNEEGTLWWHAHSEWTRATVHGAIVVYPTKGTTYPFSNPHKEEIPIILGEWWNRNVSEVLEEALETGGEFDISDAYTINGQPGDLYPCSKPETFRMRVEHGKVYLLRVINAGMNNELFFSVAKHQVTVVGTDASYTKPLTTDFIMIAPGQTMDLLLEANRPVGNKRNLYYMAATAYSSGNGVSFDNTTTTAIIEYVTNRTQPSSSSSSSPYFPSLPLYNDTPAAINFTAGFRSLANKDHPTYVPQVVDEQLIITVAVNVLDCPGNSCAGPNGTRLAASLNNISFVQPSIDILQAYSKSINGVYREGFPNEPPNFFNFTADDFPLNLLVPRQGTKAKVLEYNRTVEIVFQGTNLLAGENHPMHLHGYSFYVVGWGLGNFDREKDPLSRGYNLVDPPKRNTVGVPKNGWVAIRFTANNPGVWFSHCHFERHLTWGMDTVFIVKNGASSEAQMLPPPPDMPPC